MGTDLPKIDQPCKVIYKPQEGPQTEFHKLNVDFGGYGGTKGPGKTHAIVGESLRQVNHPAYRSRIFRRTFPQLEEIIDRCHTLYRPFSANWNGSNHCFTFPSGAKSYVCHAQYDRDVENYQGQETSLLLIDQIEQWPKPMVDYLMMQVRASAEGVKTYTRVTFNPGGVGHAWIKQQFITDKVPGKVYWDTYNVPGHGTFRRSYAFIKGTVYDNKILMKNNPQYIAQLAALPEKLRKAMMDGNFDVFEGQYFDEWNDLTHTCKPFSIPPDWRIYMSMDWGYAKPMAVLWWAVPPDMKHVYCIREFYCTNLKSPDAAEAIHHINFDIYGKDYIQSRKIHALYFDPSIATESGQVGRSIQDDFMEVWNIKVNGRKEYLHMIPADNDRISGWMTTRNMFKVQPDGMSRAIFFTTCPNCIRTIPSLVHDKTKVEDLDSDGEDHCGDSARYFFQMRFGPNVIPEKKPYEGVKDEGSRREWENVEKRAERQKNTGGASSLQGIGS